MVTENRLMLYEVSTLAHCPEMSVAREVTEQAKTNPSQCKKTKLLDRSVVEIDAQLQLQLLFCMYRYAREPQNIPIRKGNGATSCGFT